MYNKLLIKLQSKDLYVFRRRRKCLEISIVGFFFFFGHLTTLSDLILESPREPKTMTWKLFSLPTTVKR